MIIKFSIDNWMSFRDTTEISMVASLERQHSTRVPRINRHATKVLPVAAIYGGNASGKTNFFKAIAFLRHLVVSDSKNNDLPNLEQFRLGSQIKRPTSFRLDLLIGNSIFEFSVIVTKDEVIEEKLTELGSSGDRVLYHRHGRYDGGIQFEKKLDKDPFLRFAYKGTSKGQLFIANCASQNIENFLPVYNWFKHSLTLISPDSKFIPFDQLIDRSQDTINAALVGLDTGISQLAMEEISLDSVDLSDDTKKGIGRMVSETQTVRLVIGDDTVLFSRENGRLIGKKLVTYHRNQGGLDVKFEINSESDGSRRIIDLLPAFLSLSDRNSTRVFFVDELDRSLHTLLTRRILEEYLACCSNQSRSQLLFSTHDVLLMDQKLFRRDEMWVTERERDGATTLISFNDYKDIRYDKNIRKSYLAGRMGGIPRLFPGGLINVIEESHI